MRNWISPDELVKRYNDLLDEKSAYKARIMELEMMLSTAADKRKIDADYIDQLLELQKRCFAVKLS